MSVTVDITISEDIESADDDVPEPSLLQTWADAAYLDDDGQQVSSVASVLVTTADEIQALNRQYRDRDAPTNVLSFPMQTPDGLDMSLLGDIALCASVINREAEDQHKNRQAHWAHMVVHGMLHLQGFDHIEDRDALEMESKETEILFRLGFDNPYSKDFDDSRSGDA